MLSPYEHLFWFAGIKKALLLERNAFPTRHGSAGAEPQRKGALYQQAIA
jgi:hypothetical protein